MHDTVPFQARKCDSYIIKWLSFLDNICISNLVTQLQMMMPYNGMNDSYSKNSMKKTDLAPNGFKIK